VSVLLESGERIAAAALIGADGVYSNVRSSIVNDGDPLPVGAIIGRRAEARGQHHARSSVRG
jgi:2-polyprenyl-6-methoxyphenol hydroxylase-like FAD-dependent oxidoreductase